VKEGCMHLASCSCSFIVHDQCGDFCLPLCLSGRFLSLAFVSCIERWAEFFGPGMVSSCIPFTFRTAGVGPGTDQETSNWNLKAMSLIRPSLSRFDPSPFIPYNLSSHWTDLSGPPFSVPGHIPVFYGDDVIDVGKDMHRSSRVTLHDILVRASSSGSSPPPSPLVSPFVGEVFCILCKTTLDASFFSSAQLKKKRRSQKGVARCMACVIKKRAEKRSQLRQSRGERASGSSSFPVNVYQHPPLVSSSSLPPYISRAKSIKKTAEALSRSPDVCPNPFVVELCDCCGRVDCNFAI